MSETTELDAWKRRLGAVSDDGTVGEMAMRCAEIEGIHRRENRTLGVLGGAVAVENIGRVKGQPPAEIIVTL